MQDKKQPSTSVRQRLERSRQTSKCQAMNMQFFAEDSDGKGGKMSQLQKAMLAALVIVAIGILITFIVPKPNPNEDIATIAPVVEANATAKEDKNQYDTELEKRLEEILRKIDGVGAVEVMITLEATKEKVLAEENQITNEKTEEKDSTNGTRMINKESTQNKVVMADGNKPYVVKEEMPKVAGVVIVAEGTDNPVVENAIRESVCKVLNIEHNKVSVCKMGKN